MEVIRVVQYDKDWNRLKATNIRKVNTVGYRHITAADMAEVDGKLLIHTNHTMYKIYDGLNHQANLRFVIDIDSMDLLQRDCGIFNNSTGYVSHSFNQLVDVAADGGVYTADHGDGCPRGMALFSWPESSIVGRMATEEEFAKTWSNMAGLPTMVLTMDIYGRGGDNYTGAELGGLEVSSTHAILAGTSKPQDGTNQGTYNIFVTATDRDNFTDSGNKFTWVTSYGDSSISCTNPYLLDLHDDTFLLMWTERQNGNEHILCWTTLDKKGNRVDDIHRTPGDLSDVHPMFNDDGDLVWFTSSYFVPEFCTLNLTTNQLTKTMATAIDAPLSSTPSSWAQAEVTAANKAYLVTESNRGNFQAPITRVQFAELVVNFLEIIMNSPMDIDQSKQFSDTTDPSVLKAASAGIVEGIGGGKFDPNAPITREQIATMLSRAVEYNDYYGGSDLAPLPGSLAGYTDADQVSPWAKEGVGQLAANGIMKGTSNTSLSPKESASVEACILLVYRLYDTCMKINEIPMDLG